MTRESDTNVKIKLGSDSGEENGKGGFENHPDVEVDGVDDDNFTHLADLKQPL